MSDHPARRLWATLETIHDVVYFAPGVRDAGVGLGLRGFWMTYFAFRAAPLGAVGAEPVIACSVSVDALTAAGIDESSCAAAAQLLAPVAATADATGRTLFAANSVLRLEEGPVGALWLLAATGTSPPSSPAM